jgi:RNA polymerase sigma factor (sigma-70 family)
MTEWTPDIERLQRFDDAEWLAAERCFAGRLIAYVGRRVADVQAREDIVQESFLGAVRGIAAFDSAYSFEQYLFGICRNRTIDWLRRRKAARLVAHDEQEERVLLEELARTDETPSRIVRGQDVLGRGRELLAAILRGWVEETWQAGEFVRLMVIESLFAGGWRNRDTWDRFGLRDETAVAGIKFRALKRLRELAQAQGLPSELHESLADRAEEGRTGIDVGAVWRAARASCPARHWLAREIAGTLESEPARFVRFHLDEMRCVWCQANRDDLEQSEGALEPLLERVRASTARYLRSRTRPPGDAVT